MKKELKIRVALLVAVVAVAVAIIVIKGRMAGKTQVGGGGKSDVATTVQIKDSADATSTQPRQLSITQEAPAGTSNMVFVGDGWLEAEDPVAVTKSLNDALEDNNIEQILAESDKLKRHPDPEVRSRVVFALGWVGISGLPALTSMLNDPDPDVAEEVISNWRSSLSSVKSDIDKAELLGTASKALTMGETMVDDILFDMLLELSSLDSIYALPELADLLAATTNPEHKEEIVDTLHTMMEHEDPAVDAELLIQQAKEEAARLALEQQQLNPGPEDVQGLPGRPGEK